MATTQEKSPFHIVICGSMSALGEMEALAARLRRDGYRVSTPVPEEAGLDWSALAPEQAVARKRQFLNGYFDTIGTGDAVLIVNTEKHGVAGYIGANTLMEAACGHALKKPVFFLNEPGDQPCRLEALAVSSGTLDGDLSRLTGMLS